ncbi:MAG: hypothetical protein JOY75_14155 [Hyphomicrobiales bacterium]|nr:hypothetical protein [Hyphomicrobiales bacterium]
MAVCARAQRNQISLPRICLHGDLSGAGVGATHWARGGRRPVRRDCLFCGRRRIGARVDERIHKNIPESAGESLDASINESLDASINESLDAGSGESLGESIDARSGESLGPSSGESLD